MFELNNDNFVLFASMHYTNTQCVDEEEFYEDLIRIKYIKRLLTRYELYEDLQERLILNHLIIFYNVFGIEAANKMLLYKIKDRHLPLLKPFLVLLGYLPEDTLSDVISDNFVIKKLREI